MGPPAVSRLRRLFATCAILIISRVCAQDPICFGPEGVVDEGIFACQPNAERTACCAPGDVCYSNGLCGIGPTTKNAITPFFWNGCTKSDFGSPECFTGCSNSQGNGIKQCPKAGPNRYCCYGFSGCDCTDPLQIISIPAGRVLTTIDPSKTATPRPSTSSTSTSSPSTTPKTTSSPTSKSTATATPKTDHESSLTSPTSSSDPSETTSTSSPTPPATSSHTSTPSPSSTDPAISPPPSTTASSSLIGTTQPSQNSTNNNLAIGVGVGVGVPLILAVLALIYFLKRRQPTGRENVTMPDLPPPKPYHEEMGGFYNRFAELSGGVETRHDPSAPRELPAFSPAR